MISQEEIKKLVLKVREENDRTAKEKLLSEFYVGGCKYAAKLVNTVVYTDLISPTSEEITSLTYQAFEKTIKNLKFEENKKTLSFRNFFYLIIKYQAIGEIKTTLNYRIVPHFSEEINKINFEIRGELDTERDCILALDIQNKFSEILKFLENKSVDYVKILILKSQGFKNKEICELLELTAIALKARLQYIRRLVREEFGHSSFNL